MKNFSFKDLLIELIGLGLFLLGIIFTALCGKGNVYLWFGFLLIICGAGVIIYGILYRKSNKNDNEKK